jgi:hypothetical protein
VGNTLTTTPIAIATLTSLPIGNWILVGTCTIGNATTFANISISSTVAVDSEAQVGVVSNTNVSANVQVTRFVQNTAATTYYLTGNANSSFSVYNIYLKAIRIG